MPSTTTSVKEIPALDALRQPIRDYQPPGPAGEAFQGKMLCLADLLEELWNDEEDETLESDVVWSALYAFPGLIATGPPAEDLVDLASGGDLMDGDAADTLTTLKTIRGTLSDFEPPGFAAALWRGALLAVYRLIELFVLLGDDRGVEHCFELLVATEAMADKFSGRA